MKTPKHTDEIIDALDFSERAINIKSLVKHSSFSSLKNHTLDQVSEIEIDKVYFSGQFPTVYFKSVKDFDEATQRNICEIHKKIWNERKVPFFIVNSPTEIKVYNCFIEPIDPERQLEKIGKIELYSYALSETETKLEELVRVFNRTSIDSGLFWKEKKYAEQLDASRRVDKVLMKNLAEVRSQLVSDGLDVDIVHDLLLRSLFILYLEDKKATTPDFYEKYKKDATSYFDILENITSSYNLFDKLEHSFNGNLCPVTNSERKL